MKPNRTAEEAIYLASLDSGSFARLTERERCAKIVESEGNRSNDDEIKKHCARLAAVIRSGVR